MSTRPIGPLKPLPPLSKPMRPRWEYRRYVYNDYDSHEADEEIAVLGEEGWEAYAVVHEHMARPDGDEDMYHWYYFKREK